MTTNSDTTLLRLWGDFAVAFHGPVSDRVDQLYRAIMDAEPEGPIGVEVQLAAAAMIEGQSDHDMTHEAAAVAYRSLSRITGRDLLAEARRLRFAYVRDDQVRIEPVS